eukprot:3983172-Amphidinium_carterae.1
MDSGIGPCVDVFGHGSSHNPGSPHLVRQGLPTVGSIAGDGAWAQRTPCSHAHEVDQMSRDIMFGSYIRQHVPSYTQRPVMNDVRGFGYVPGASHNLNGASGYPYHGNHAVMGQVAPWDNTRRKESDSISISELPQPSKFRSWKLEVKRAVAAASTCPHEAFAWVSETARSTPTLSPITRSPHL